MLVCSWCGVLLPRRDSLQTMRSKLAQLARFGLDSDGRPLLEPPEKDG